MKILHVCLAAFYIDNYGYQENILPKMHKKQGHSVRILASTETYLENRVLGYIKPSTYVNTDNIQVERIPYSKYLPSILIRKLRIYSGVLNSISKFEPDIIFIHDCQFISIKDIARYVSLNPKVRIYVDSHTDFVNSGRNWISKNILHKILYKWCAQKINPHTKKFYGTLPARNEFYEKVYNIDKSKIELLELGADLSKVDFNKKDEIREEILKKYSIPKDSFVLITGGKIDERKQIHKLLNSFKCWENPEIHLIIFGSPTPSMQEILNKAENLENVHKIGWLDSDKINDHLLAADLGVFPGTHSVLWEQSVGLGLPCVFRKWDGIQHVDVGGNCVFINTDDELEIRDKVLKIYEDKNMYNELKLNSVNKGIKQFSYYEIAKRAIEEN